MSAAQRSSVKDTPVSSVAHFAWLCTTRSLGPCVHMPSALCLLAFICKEWGCSAEQQGKLQVRLELSQVSDARRFTSGRDTAVHVKRGQRADLLQALLAQPGQHAAVILRRINFVASAVMV